MVMWIGMILVLLMILKIYNLLKGANGQVLYFICAKEEQKITKKHKDTSDKFLYKTSRDIVEHFRKMSKMTDDSRIKNFTKTNKTNFILRSIQLGGVAPFTVYRPLGAGGEMQ